MNEVKHLVNPGVGATDDTGKGNGGMGWRAGGKATKRTEPSQALKVGQATLLHHGFHDPWVHAIEGDYQHAVTATLVAVRRFDAGRNQCGSGTGADVFDELSSSHNKDFPSM